MLKRDLYLHHLRDFYTEYELIKIIYGLRRCGKSIILQQIIEEVIENITDENHIIYINFESLDYYHLKDALTLNQYIKSLVKDEKKYYVFLDEIQKVKDFELCINSLRITQQFSIFITGSNSKMTFNELSTDLSGRYVSFRVNPLNFKEVVTLKNINPNDYSKTLHDIFEWGSLPQRFFLPTTDSVYNYITDVYNSIVLKDVVERLGIKDVTGFNKILQYIIEIEGREFSANNVINYVKSEHKSISSQTLYTYLDALCSTFIVNKVYRYDIEGKKILKTLNKYYLTDLGIKKIKTNKKELNYSRALENMVYNDLITKGYDVYIGKTSKGEIDFIAIKNLEFKYIQVAYSLTNEDTIKREFGAYDYVNDNYPKYVISLDKENLSRDGIIHLNAIDFFLSDDF